MSRTKAIIGVCLIFLMGIFTGVALSLKLVEQRIHSLVEGGPEVLGELMVRRLDHQLKLNPQQRGQLQKIVESADVEVAKVRAGVQPQVNGIMASSITQIRAILSPEQATKFDELVEQGRARWSNFGEEKANAAKP